MTDEVEDIERLLGLPATPAERTALAPLIERFLEAAPDARSMVLAWSPGGEFERGFDVKIEWTPRRSRFASGELGRAVTTALERIAEPGIPPVAGVQRTALALIDALVAANSHDIELLLVGAAATKDATAHWEAHAGRRGSYECSSDPDPLRAIRLAIGPFCPDPGSHLDASGEP